MRAFRIYLKTLKIFIRSKVIAKIPKLIFAHLKFAGRQIIGIKAETNRSFYSSHFSVLATVYQAKQLFNKYEKLLVYAQKKFFFRNFHNNKGPPCVPKVRSGQILYYIPTFKMSALITFDFDMLLSNLQYSLRAKIARGIHFR